MGCLNAPFTLVVELAGPRHRTVVGMGLMIAYSIGEAFVGIFAMLLLEWRWFHYISSIPLFLMLPIYFILPESPRWLNTKGKYEELKELFQSMAKINGTKLPTDLEERLRAASWYERHQNTSCRQLNACSEKKIRAASNKEKHTDGKLCQLFSHPKLRSNTIIMFCNWSLITLGMNHIYSNPLSHLLKGFE